MKLPTSASTLRRRSRYSLVTSTAERWRAATWSRSSRTTERAAAAATARGGIAAPVLLLLRGAAASGAAAGRRCDPNAVCCADCGPRWRLGCIARDLA